MLLTFGWRRLGGGALGMAVSLLLTGCAGWTGRLFQRPAPIECERFLVAAETAPMAADSAGPPTAHAQAVATHAYHACVATHDAEVAKRPSRTAP